MSRLTADCMLLATRILRGGDKLVCTMTEHGPTWAFLDCQRECDPLLVSLLFDRGQLVACEDCLFPGALSQTWAWAGEI